MLVMMIVTAVAAAPTYQYVPYEEDLAALNMEAMWTRWNADCQTTLKHSVHHFANWVSNLHYQAHHNSRNRADERNGVIPEDSERLGPNCETHLSYSEWRDYRGFTIRDAFLMAHPEPEASFEHMATNETEFNTTTTTCSSSSSHCDWCTHTNVCPPVQDQGQCGACFSFSATSQNRACTVLKTGANTPVLSQEQGLDCSQAEGNVYGCNSGYPTAVYQYIIDNGGINSAANYPYSAYNGTNSSCIVPLTKTAVSTAIQWYYVYANYPSYMISNGMNQPMAVDWAAGSRMIQNYVSGIITNATACGNVVDHSTMLTGWSTSGSTAYWRLQNQWSIKWGESGFIRIQRDTTDGGVGKCSINSHPTFSTC